MTDEIIVGLFALGGTLFGFLLSKISDSITAERGRKRYQILLRFKLNTIKAMIKKIIDHVNRCDKITDQESFTIIEELLLRNDIKKEISKLESLTEKAIKFNFDEKEDEYLVKLIHLKFGINQLLYSGTIHAKEPIPDEKPDLMKLLTEIYNDVEYLSNYHSQNK
jgi:hypothetical protein